ncbi:uncharacterized protein LOC121735769 isoform X1 [Aricia agestis]|uniref:uncharacterized protein LOC121735769 isoform X1 n=1 Tax=Aricia agestis TaxID=91739 RepID=UPI001C206A50|nr:uncharacterized protein LOC121735769 isoform X1 [Aricia agestis]
MPGKIKVKVLAGRNLPVMDRASDTTDAFVEIKFGGITHKTDVCRKSLNPHWNSTEWYRFEVDESELQDEPLQLRLMDHDTYSANDAIGKVVISLAPLLTREAGCASTGAAGGAVLSGWLPVFDTLHGIRGELHVVVKLELFSDFNKYKTSSVGVQFFHCPMIPPGYQATAIHGFVEELVVNDDPEYQWIDKIRTPRASNEARQVAFIKLSNQVQRLVGLKAAELGANAVVGYQQDFDLEGEAGVVARAIGTAVSIKPLPNPQPNNLPPCTQQQLKKYLDILATDEESVTDLNQYYQTHQEELVKIVGILNPKDPSLLDEPDGGDDDEKSFESLIQPTGFTEAPKPYTGGRSIYQDEYISQKSLKHLSEDQDDLDRLLKRTATTNSIGPLTRLKKLKGSMFRRRRRDSQKSEKQDDEISLRSTSSDTSRISLNDIKKEMRRFKRIKVPKLAKIEGEEEEGIGMASILARSVIHAHTSLACISEAQDSEASPDSTLRKTSESEPTVNVAEEQKKMHVEDVINDINKRKTPEGHCSSLDNIKSDEMPIEPQRKKSESCPTSPIVERSDNLLKLPGDIGYFGSISSALSAESSEIYTTSDEDEDDSSDMKSNCEQSMETTSSLVSSVLRHDVDPNFIAQMEQKLTDLELASHVQSDTKTEAKEESKPNLKETKDDAEVKDLIEKKDDKSNLQSDNKINSQENREVSSTAPKDDEKFVPAKYNFNFPSIFVHKNLQTTLSAPSSPVERKSFVYRSSKRIKKQLSKISKSRMVKSLSHYSLLPKKKHEDPKTAMSQPGSSSDVTSKAPSDTVLGYPFLSYTDLLSLDKEQPPERLHKSDELETCKVSMYIGSQPESRASFSGPSDRDHNHLQKPKPLLHHMKEKPEVKPASLTHTAMEVILIDKVQSLLIPTSPDINAENQKFFDKVNIELEKIENAESDKNKTIKLDKNKNSDDKDKRESIKNKKGRKKEKTLVRQDSIRSEETKMSKNIKTNLVIPSKLTNQPMLQHFHPISAHLETIHSLSPSLDRGDSLDTNASVCGNSHAVCDVDRSERERDKCDKDKGSPKHARHESFGGREVGSSNAQNVSLNSSSTPLGIHRRSSDSDLSVTPKGGSQNASVGNIGGGAILRPSMNSNNLDMLEYPFLTMTEFPPGFIVHIGGTVCSRSVKLVDGGGESAARAAWWAELRTEIRAHARALRCTAVLGYSERASVREDVCVLSASGTAAVINLDCDLATDDTVTVGDNAEEEESCGAAHVPYSPGAPPYRAELAGCGGCRRARVPTVLLATCAKPSRLVSYGKSVVVTAVAARGRRAPPSAEPGARDLSDQLPFLEYELHKLLLAKLRMQGANALFSLQTQVAIGERCVMALASGAAVRLAALPPPAPPRIKASEKDKNAMEIQKALWDTFNANKATNGYDVAPEHIPNGVLPECEGEEAPALELCADKDTCVLELDEAEDVETARALAERRPASVLMSSALRPARAPPHAFTQVWRARIGGGCQAERMVSSALAAARYKLRRLQPAALAAPTYHLDLPDDEIQLVVSGTAIPLQDPSKLEPAVERNGNQDDDDIFALDEEQLAKSPPDQVEEKNNGPGPGRVALSSGAAAGAGGAGRRVCALRLLFVRETTAVRELGGLSGFLHTFTCEVMAIVRAYTAALGGNALTSFYMTQLMLQDNAHKNQGQCLLSVGGDVVHVT